VLLSAIANIVARLQINVFIVESIVCESRFRRGRASPKVRRGQFQKGNRGLCCLAHVGRHRRVRGLLFARIFQNSIKCKAEISSFLENQLFKSQEEMQTGSANLEFERASLLRDQIMEVKSGAGVSCSHGR
jgi:hypothetical protein